MNPKRTLMATWLAMLGIQTLGSVDSKHRLPAPKQFVAISALWGILFIAAETRLARSAAQLSWLLLLTASVIGPFGKRLIDFLNMVARDFAIPPAQPAASNIPPEIVGGNATIPRPTVPA